jgi:hypothetical protein
MPGAVRVENLRDLQAGLAKLERETRLGFRHGLREVVEPVRTGAEQLAMQNIRRMPHSPQWSRMRIGVTRNLVYVAPRQRGVKTRGRHNFGRPNLGDLLMERAMEPALEQHAAEVEARLGELLDRTLDKFNHGAI